MDANQTIVNVLVLALSGSASVIGGFIFKRLGDIASDVAKIREQVGDHSATLAEHKVRLETLRSDVDDLKRRSLEAA